MFTPLMFIGAKKLHLAFAALTIILVISLAVGPTTNYISIASAQSSDSGDGTEDDGEEKKELTDEEQAALDAVTNGKGHATVGDYTSLADNMGGAYTTNTATGETSYHSSADVTSYGGGFSQDAFNSMTGDSFATPGAGASSDISGLQSGNSDFGGDPLGAAPSNNGGGGFNAGDISSGFDPYSGNPISGGTSEQTGYGYGNENGFTGSSNDFGDYSIADVTVTSNDYNVGDIMDDFNAGSFYGDYGSYGAYAAYDGGFSPFDSNPVSGSTQGYALESWNEFSPYAGQNQTASDAYWDNFYSGMYAEKRAALIERGNGEIILDGIKNLYTGLTAPASTPLTVDEIAALANQYVLEQKSLDQKQTIVDQATVAAAAARQSNDLINETFALFSAPNAPINPPGVDEAAVFAVGNQLLDGVNEAATAAEINGLLAVEFARQGNTETAEAYAVIAAYQAEVAESQVNAFTTLDGALLTDTYEDLIAFSPTLGPGEDFELFESIDLQLAMGGRDKEDIEFSEIIMLGLGTDILSNQNSPQNVTAVARMWAGELDPTTRSKIIDGTADTKDWARAVATLVPAINRAGSRGTSVSKEIYRDQQYSFYNPDKRAQFEAIYQANKGALEAAAREALSGQLAKGYTNLSDLITYPTANHYQNTSVSNASWASKIETLGTIPGYKSNDSHTFYNGYYPVSTPEITPTVQTALNAIDDLLQGGNPLDNLSLGYVDGNISLQLPGGIGISFNSTNPSPTNSASIQGSSGEININIGGKYSDTEARDIFSGIGISVNKTASQGTSLDGMNGRTIAEVAQLNKDCSCSIVVTGGTERGHAAGEFSHSNGYKADVRAYDPVTGKESAFTEFAKSNFTQTGTRGNDPVYQNPERPNVSYVLESDHWDITVPPSPGESKSTAVTAVETSTSGGSKSSTEISFSFGGNGVTVAQNGQSSQNSHSFSTGIEVVDAALNAFTGLLTGGGNPAITGPLSVLGNIAGKTGGSLSSFLGSMSGGGGGDDTPDHPLANTYSEGSYRVYSEGSYGRINDKVESDLSVVALKAESTVTNEYRFRGTLARTLSDNGDNLSFDEISTKFGTTIENELLLDLDCDETIDEIVEFTTPYRAILPRSGGTEVLLSEYMVVPRSGLHCFAFDVDINDDIDETNERNNQSEWRAFITGFGGTLDDLPSDTSLPVFTFEVKSYDATGATTVDWQDSDISIENGEELAFRWNAPGYNSCLPFIYPVNYSFDGDVTTNSRDTDIEQIDVRELTKTYAVQCRQGNKTRVEKIRVTVQ